MTRTTTTVPLPRTIVAIAGIALSILGCEKSSSSAAAPNACTPPGASLDAMSRSDIARWAGGLRYASPDSARAYVYGFAASDSVTIEAVDRASARTLSPTGCVIAQLRSARALPASGIGIGRTYVWVDSLTGGYKTVLIPEDPAISITVHALGVHAHTRGDVPLPTVGALGYCGYCDSTARRWCRAGLDSLSTTRVTDLRALTKDELRDTGIRRLDSARRPPR